MACTSLSVGKWLRLIWLTAWAASLVTVITATAFVVISSRRVTPGAVTLVLGASTALFVIVESMGVEARPPPVLTLPAIALLRSGLEHRDQKAAPDVEASLQSKRR